jgi:hypothetical protein
VFWITRLRYQVVTAEPRKGDRTASTRLAPLAVPGAV